MGHFSKSTNFASITKFHCLTSSLQGAKPLDLYSVSSIQVPNLPKRHRPHGSIARSLKSLAQAQPSSAEPAQFYQNMYSPLPSSGSTFKISNSHSEHGEPKLFPNRRDSGESGWDVVEDTALRWATDFKPLAAAGSRLAGLPVVCFATWSDETRKGKGTGGQLLAVATRSNIVLYETPKGERAYRFVKVRRTNDTNLVLQLIVIRNSISHYSLAASPLSIMHSTTPTDLQLKSVPAAAYTVINVLIAAPAP